MVFKTPNLRKNTEINQEASGKTKKLLKPKSSTKVVY